METKEYGARGRYLYLELFGTQMLPAYLIYLTLGVTQDWQMARPTMPSSHNALEGDPTST